MKAALKAAPKSEPTLGNRKEFCEFFAGIGLVRAGLEPSGWRCVYANDIDPKKQTAYEACFGRSDHFHLADVWNTDEVVGRIPGRPSLMTASFPCIDLSLAGHYRGLDGDHSSTFFGFAKALESLEGRRPPLVMLENVTGFLSSRKGRDFATAARRLAELGYWLDAFVLDACHFTPQSRPRVFVIGMVPELIPKEKAAEECLWPVERASAVRPASVIRMKKSLDLPTGWVTLPLPDPPERQSALAEVIDMDDGQAWWDEGNVQRHYGLLNNQHQRQLDEILASKRVWVGTAFRRTRAQYSAEIRFDGVAGCLRTPKGGSAKQIVVAVDAGRLRMRWMNPREYARLQGAPDFPLVGTTIQQLWGFGDAVCVPAISWIDRHVLTPLYETAERLNVQPPSCNAHGLPPGGNRRN